MAISIFLLAAFIVANLPWLNNRVFMIVPLKNGKPAWLRLLEWFILYFVMGFIAISMEKQANGTIYPQDWEFYAVTLSLFMVFAFPGFIYRYDYLKLLNNSK